MIREFVESSLIKSVGYNEALKLLEIEFWDDNKIVEFIDVPLEEYFDFMDAKSLGKYYARNIINKYKQRQD